MQVSINWLKELVDLNLPIKKLVEVLPLKTIGIKKVTDQYIELDMKGYNRTDLLSMRGVAYEVSALTNSRIFFQEPQEPEFAWNQTKLPNSKVIVKDTKSAPLYCVVKIEKLKVGKSSLETIRKLEESGMRSINNIADITNLIMLEYGQPLHAFDTERVANGEIILRAASQKEEIVTLDGKTRKLSGDLLITDPTKPIGIAGVMGGQNSEITDTTNAIFLEAAIFDSAAIRKTTMGLGLPSEASKRFQHGLTKKRLLQALDAAIKMYQVLGGRLISFTMTGNFEDQPKNIHLRKEKLESLVGVNFTVKQVEEYLTRLNFKFEAIEGGWEVQPPYFRLDITIEEDIIEEVARMYGYEKIPPARVVEMEPLQKEDPIFNQIRKLKQELFKIGFTEIQTYSFYSTQVLNALGFDETNRKILVKVANPISSETEYLRMNIWPNLAEVVGRNIKKGYKDIGIFEIGKTFQVDKAGNPSEQYRLSIALSNNSDNPIEELISLTKKMNLNLELLESKPEGVGTTLFHPKRFVRVEKDGKFIGGLAEVHLRVLNKLGIEKRVAVLELHI